MANFNPQHKGPGGVIDLEPRLMFAAPKMALGKVMDAITKIDKFGDVVCPLWGLSRSGIDTQIIRILGERLPAHYMMEEENCWRAVLDTIKDVLYLPVTNLDMQDIEILVNSYAKAAIFHDSAVEARR